MTCAPQLQGVYFAGSAFVAPSLLTRIDPRLALRWARSTDEVVGTGQAIPISIRWTGLLHPANNETFTLILRAAAGNTEGGGWDGAPSGDAKGNRQEAVMGSARVWLQGQLVLSLPGALSQEEARADVIGNTKVSVRPNPVRVFMREHLHASMQKSSGGGGGGGAGEAGMRCSAAGMQQPGDVSYCRMHGDAVEE